MRPAEQGVDLIRAVGGVAENAPYAIRETGLVETRQGRLDRVGAARAHHLMIVDSIFGKTSVLGE